MSTNTFPDQHSVPEQLPEQRSARAPIAAALTWLGGGHWRELGERHERSSHVIAGVVVLLGATLAWLVATLAVAGSARWPVPAILPFTLVFGVLVGAVTRAIASGPTRSWPGMLTRGAVGFAVGVVVGELAALVFFAGAIDRRLDEQAARTAESAPAVAQAAADLNRTRQPRTALDTAVDQARQHRDDALVTARCEYNPTPACPQTRITGVPGAGPETRTANELLADAQRELDNVMAARDSQAPALDSRIADRERALADARNTATANTDRSLGARWVAMHDYTLANGGALMLRVLTIAFFTLLSLLPLVLRLWRGETTHDRRATARADRERAELAADTAIAVKRAEVRAAAETMWAEQQLARARLAVEAQTEIDRAQYRRRVSEALEGKLRAPSSLDTETLGEDVYLPIGAEAEAARRGPAELPSGRQSSGVDLTGNLPARLESGSDIGGQSGTSIIPTHIPTLPDVTKAAARWIRPLVPDIVARAIDTTAQPLRAARQVFEEVEEITFTLKRTHKVTVYPDESPEQTRQVRSASTDARANPRPIESSRAEPDEADDSSLPAGARQPALTDRDAPHVMPGPDGPRQLPPGE